MPSLCEGDGFAICASRMREQSNSHMRARHLRREPLSRRIQRSFNSENKREYSEKNRVEVIMGIASMPDGVFSSSGIRSNATEIKDHGSSRSDSAARFSFFSKNRTSPFFTERIP